MNKTLSMFTYLPVATLLISACSTMRAGEYTAGWSENQTPEVIKLSNGFSLRYLRAGRGRPLVLLHTIRTQLDYFEQLVPALKGQYQVYVLDLPGHGQSSLLATEYTEELFRKSVTEFIQHLNLRDVTLVGESIGAVLALTVSAELPDRIVRAVALNPYDYGEDFGGGIRRSGNGWIIGFFNVFGRYTIEPKFLLAAVLRGGFYDPSKLPQDLVDELYRTGLRDGYRAAEYSLFKNWQTWVDARKRYAQITIPVTLVYSRDDWSRPSERERNKQAIRNSELILLEGAGHFSALENPAEVANIILSQRTQST
jgi:pimeloyl-ACP methyl ester carboxylesterase